MSWIVLMNQFQYLQSMSFSHHDLDLAIKLPSIIVKDGLSP